MSTFKIKNKYLVGLASWLNEQPLVGKESRERTRFVNLLIERLAETEKFRQGIIDKFILLDKETGERLKKINENGEEVWDIPESSLEEYSKEYLGLLEDEWVLDVLDGNKEKIKVMKDVVLNTSYVFGPKETDGPVEKMAKMRQATDYEEWCKAFEEVDFSS